MTERPPHPTKWKPGQSGNPAGRPRGARSLALQALDQIGEAGASEILVKAVEAAKGGDARAAELILSRVWPARKGRPINLEIPPLNSPGDLSAAIAAVIAAVAAGDITPDEGSAVSALLDAHRRAIETTELEARIAALEAKNEPS